MKQIIIAILCFFTTKAFCQTNELVVQEKSSDWIKVLAAPTVQHQIAVRPKHSTTVKRKTSSKKTSLPKKNTEEEFDRTNSQVNRFKKAKKG